LIETSFVTFRWLLRSRNEEIKIMYEIMMQHMIIDVT
jgi:hypothetical protein